MSSVPIVVCGRVESGRVGRLEENRIESNQHESVIQSNREEEEDTNHTIQ